MKSSCMTTVLDWRRGPRLVNISLISTVALSLTYSGAYSTTYARQAVSLSPLPFPGLCSTTIFPIIHILHFSVTRQSATRTHRASTERCSYPPEIVDADQVLIVHHVAAAALGDQLVLLDVHVLEEALEAAVTSQTHNKMLEEALEATVTSQADNTMFLPLRYYVTNFLRITKLASRLLQRGV